MNGLANRQGAAQRESRRATRFIQTQPPADALVYQHRAVEFQFLGDFSFRGRSVTQAIQARDESPHSSHCSDE